MKVPMSNLQLEFLIRELQKRLERAEAQIIWQEKQISKLRWSADGWQDSNDPRENDDIR